MSETTRFRRQADCGHDYMAIRAQGRRHKLCPCCEAKQRLASVLRDCAICGRLITDVQVTGRGRKYHRACVPKTSHRRIDPRPTPRPCARCGEEFSPVRDANIYCSRECQAYHSVNHEPRACEYSACGKMFRPVNTRQRSCSALHARKAWIERNPERDADVRRNVYHRRRAKKKGAASGDPVIRSEIAERDAWTCHLCCAEIPRAAAWPDPLSLSLDHVVPLSKGGVHDPTNVKAAHLRCNVAKGDRLAA